MSGAPTPHEKTISKREGVSAIWLVFFMAVVTSSLRVTNWTAGEVTLWYLYGRATVTRDHLRIIRIKPQLVVSNGDVLRGIGAYYYFIGVAIWIPLALGLMSLIYYTLLPKRHRKVWQAEEETQGGGAMRWALVLPFLVTALLPMWAGLAFAVCSVAGALIWARRIQYDKGAPQ